MACDCCKCKCDRPKEGRYGRLLDPIHGVNLTKAEADWMIALIQSRVRLPPASA